MTDACACIYIDDFAPADFIKQELRRARKLYKCSECGCAINTGETYEYTFGNWTGSTDTYRTCKDCLSIRDTFFCNGYIFTNLFEALGEHIREIDGNVSANCILPLTQKARNDVFEIIEEVWKELDELDNVYSVISVVK